MECPACHNHLTLVAAGASGVGNYLCSNTHCNWEGNLDGEGREIKESESEAAVPENKE